MEKKIEKIENFLEIAKKNFQEWNSALLTKNSEKVAELYTRDATFLPTMSGDFKFGKDGAVDYFEHFLIKNPEGKIIDEKIQIIDNSHYLHSGFYNFEVDFNKQRKITQARFSFVWQKNKNGKWKIIHHHSSLKPN